MNLDTSKLENVKKTTEKITARCPACAEEGRDKKGDHLFIAPSGHFGCIAYLGTAGAQHRKRIFTLASAFENKPIIIRRPVINDKQPIIPDILGRLGRHFSTYAGKSSHE